MSAKTPQDVKNSAVPIGFASERIHPGRIFSTPDTDKYLDILQLHRLEQSFRDWADAATRADVRSARKRILLIFLLIRYTGAKLSEVLGVNPHSDIDFDDKVIRFGRIAEQTEKHDRKVYLPEALCREIRGLIADSEIKNGTRQLLSVDPGFLRRKFYERAEACGIPKQLGAPEILRKSRAVELMQHDMPLPAVQMLMGHATPNLASSYVSFSAEDVQRVIGFFMERDSARKTSARNSFFGKIQEIQEGDIQTRVELITIDGHRVSTVITNDSLQRLGLKVGGLITAEVKAPWVVLLKNNGRPECSADNVFSGVVERIRRGEINTEFVVRISEGTRICAMVTSESCRKLGIEEGDNAWVLFNSASVVLLSG